MNPTNSLPTDETLLARMDEAFGKLPERHATYWCGGGICACMGCVNGDAYELGVTREQWLVWMQSRHPGVLEERKRSQTISDDEIVRLNALLKLHPSA